MKSEPLKAILASLHTWLSRYPEIQLALIYGSLARGQEHEKSDLDLALHLGRTMTLNERVHFAQELGQILNRSVDLLDLASAKGFILKEALSRSVMVQNRNPNILASLMKMSLLDDADYGSLRRRALAERRKKSFGI